MALKRFTFSPFMLESFHSEGGIRVKAALIDKPQSLSICLQITLSSLIPYINVQLQIQRKQSVLYSCSESDPEFLMFSQTRLIVFSKIHVRVSEISSTSKVAFCENARLFRLMAPTSNFITWLKNYDLPITAIRSELFCSSEVTLPLAQREQAALH